MGWGYSDEEDSMSEQVRWMPKGGCDPVGSRVLEEPVVPWREDPTLEKEKSLSSSYTEEEGGIEKKCDELIKFPTAHLCCATDREDIEKTGSEVEPGEKGRVRARVFKIVFYFLLFYSDLIGSN